MAVSAYMIDISIVEVLLLCHGEHGVAVVLGEELALVVEQLERVPLARVVAGGDDDATCRMAHADGQFGGRGRGKPDIEHVIAHSYQCAADHQSDHVARDARVAAYHDTVAARRVALTDKLGIRRGKLDDVQRVERIAGRASDGSTDAGNGFDQCHIFSFSFVIACYLPRS